MKLISEVRDSILYLSWEAVECEFCRVFAKIDGMYVELASPKGTNSLSVSLLPVGETEVFVQAVSMGVVIAETPHQTVKIEVPDVIMLLEDYEREADKIYQLHISKDSNAKAYRLYGRDEEEAFVGLRNYETPHIRIRPVKSLYKIGGVADFNSPEALNDMPGNGCSEEFELRRYNFALVTVHKCYKDGLCLSWKYFGRADGFEICVAGTKDMIADVPDGTVNYGSVSGICENASLYVRSYVNTPVGRMYLAESESISYTKEKYGIPKVSVIIPVGNSEGYLARCINSVLASDFSKIEIIIAAGVSLDSTLEIADWYEKNYLIVRLVKAENIETAYNKAVNMAVGKYILTVSPFDTLHTDMIRKYYDAATKNGTDVVFSAVNCKSTNNLLTVSEFPFDKRPYDCEDYMSILATEKVVDNNKWNKMFSKELLKKCASNFTKYDDSAFLPYAVSHGGSFIYLNEVLYERDVIAHERAIKDIYEWQTFEENITRKSEGIEFFIREGNPLKFSALSKYAYMQIDTFSEECGDRHAFQKCIDTLHSINEKDQIEKYNKMLKMTRRKQRTIRIILFIMLGAIVVTRLVSMIMQFMK